MPDPIAVFMTWTTYGVWLQGDPRGSVTKLSGGRSRVLASTPALERSNQSSLKHEATRLNERQRASVETAIRGVCDYRGWMLHAINVRSNHVHVVVSPTKEANAAMADLKAWSTRRLRDDELIGAHRRVWTRHGSTRWIHSAESLAAAIDYVERFQDRPRE